jgi:hypothetical protein
MWQLYLKNNEGIAIRTNKVRLYKSIGDAEQEIGASKVRYIDYDTQVWYHPIDYPWIGYSFITPLIHKRKEFIHEKEFRIYHYDWNREKDGYWEGQTNAKGELILVDVPNLVESVVFHPTSDERSQKVIIELSKDLGYSFLFEKSRLSRPALF